MSWQSHWLTTQLSPPDERLTAAGSADIYWYWLNKCPAPHFWALTLLITHLAINIISNKSSSSLRTPKKTIENHSHSHWHFQSFYLNSKPPLPPELLPVPTCLLFVCFVWMVTCTVVAGIAISYHLVCKILEMEIGMDHWPKILRKTRMDKKVKIQGCVLT